jgi:peptidoglycan hydrolase-like protein with peptidoglycan-binding domain
MARILFDRSPSGFRTVRGEVIRKLQERLGLSGAQQDGVYGGDTQTALRKWQSEHQTAATGAVDVDTWAGVMQQPIPEIFDRSLQISAAFEGHGFTKLEGNFDGAGLTWGIIGFTWSNNQLQGILREIRTEAPVVYKESFGPLATQLDEVFAQAHPAQMAFANEITLSPGSAGVRPEWKEAFARLGKSPAVQAIQMRAVKPAWDTAGKYFQQYGLSSELAMALCFDIAVQIGVKPQADAAIRAAMKAHPPEDKLREIIANAVAETAKSEYVEDVRQRKLMFARGQGEVHGDAYRLDLWGLGEFPTT